MPVAKSYQKYEILCEPFIDKGRAYVNIKKNGTLKTVRWYSDKEYASMYNLSKITGADPISCEPARPTAPVKDVLGFKNGYITIFSGPIEDWEDWFAASNARYARLWGWYVISTEEVPRDLPHDIIPITLAWRDVGYADGTLRPETEIAQVVDALRYPATDSQYIGAIGERLDLSLTIAKAIPLETVWGNSILYIMTDAIGNEFVWKTNTKSWEVGTQRHIRGTVKEHKTYHNSRQTWLTRCQEVKN